MGEPPPLGMVTFIDPRHVRPTKRRGIDIFGYSYRKAGFVEVGRTVDLNLIAMQLLPDRMPPPRPAMPRALHGLPLFDFALIA